MTRKLSTSLKQPYPGPNVLQVKRWDPRWGSPVRSMRWHPLIWERLYELESLHKHQVRVNKIAQVAVEWGLNFITTLSKELQERILGVEGAKPLTTDEEEKLREELNKKLGAVAGTLRLDERLAFALPKTMKEIIREEALSKDTTMSDIARRRLTTPARRKLEASSP